jgi:hypothetical protein
MFLKAHLTIARRTGHLKTCEFDLVRFTPFSRFDAKFRQTSPAENQNFFVKKPGPFNPDQEILTNQKYHMPQASP